ncbi:MAG: MTH1187 family thiamine-binding protein [Bacteroidales bacterium]|nr:MTH1187 family thiamine-binding protein [Bacteroidales bacterium]
MSVLLEFAMFPTDKSESVSNYVARLIDFIDKSGVRYQLTAMGSIIETQTLDEALDVVKECYKLLESDCKRVYSTLTFDIRQGHDNRIDGKVKSIDTKINRTRK